MKRIFVCCLVFITTVPFLSAQLMERNGYRNTLWSGAGNDNGDDHTEWDGVYDTFQARLGAGALSIDAMLQWAADTDYSDSGNLNGITFKNTDANVNFTLRAIKNLELGMGTYLDWKLGPAPSHGSKAWEIRYHLCQGGLSEGLPGSAPVTGASYYANYITESPDTTKALAARYYVEDLFQFAVGIPSGADTTAFLSNAGMVCTPNEKVLVALAYDKIFQDDGNLYAGSTLIVTDSLTLDVWAALDNLGGKSGNGQTGTGAALNITSDRLTIRPETGCTFYESSDYTTAWYAGTDINYELDENITAGLWTSLALGSKNKEWDNRTETENRVGGMIFDLRPDLTYYINSTDALGSTFNLQKLTTYENRDYTYWSFGFYWTHAF